MGVGDSISRPVRLTIDSLHQRNDRQCRRRVVEVAPGVGAKALARPQGGDERRVRRQCAKQRRVALIRDAVTRIAIRVGDASIEIVRVALAQQPAGRSAVAVELDMLDLLDRKSVV